MVYVNRSMFWHSRFACEMDPLKSTHHYTSYLFKCRVYVYYFFVIIGMWLQYQVSGTEPSQSHRKQLCLIIDEIVSYYSLYRWYGTIAFQEVN